MSIGVGIEVGTSIVRAVLVDLDRSDELLTAEYAVDVTDDDAVADALIRATGLVGSAHPGRVPARLAIAPEDLLVQAVDVTGRSRDDLLSLADSAARRGAADSMTIVDDGRRRRLGLVRGHAHVVLRFLDLARAAGFDDAEVEPAPIALGRVLGEGRRVVRRAVDAQTVWTALYDEGFPIAAATGPAGFGGWPTISSMPASGRHDDPEHVLAADELVAHLDDTVDRARARYGDDTLHRDADDWPVDPPALLQAGVAHPSFPSHDLRASERIGVALGAAAGAAGAAERHRRLERLTSLQAPPRPTRHPWALEQITERVTTDDRTSGFRPTTVRRADRRTARTGTPTNRDRRTARRYRRRR